MVNVIWIGKEAEVSNSQLNDFQPSYLNSRRGEVRE